eukprot:1828107-Lingulodinium_polyedra.AAC.1
MPLLLEVAKPPAGMALLQTLCNACPRNRALAWTGSSAYGRAAPKPSPTASPAANASTSIVST